MFMRSVNMASDDAPVALKFYIGGKDFIRFLIERTFGRRRWC
jgi:hypothetical protein